MCSHSACQQHDESCRQVILGLHRLLLVDSLCRRFAAWVQSRQQVKPK